ncbi:MAG: alpha/beta hydrolase fold domain-containing protein [Acidimicrobiales bacterium]
MRRSPSAVARVAAGSFGCALIALFVSSIVAPISWAGAASADSTPATPLPSSAVKVTRNVTYTDADGTTLTLDVYEPEERVPGRPGVILIHGGAWGSGKANDLDTEGKLIAREGWVAFSLNYRLADQAPHPWPDELTDVQRATRWVSANAEDYGVDNQKLIAMGLSAGGHLASLLGEIGTTVDGTGHPIDDPNPPAQVQAVIALSPPTDPQGLVSADGDVPPDCVDNKVCTRFWRLPLVTNFIGCPPSECPQSYEQASLVARATKASVPIWFANSTNEIVGLPQAKAFDEALTKAGVEHHFELLDGGTHADEYLQRVWNPMMEWAAGQVGVAPPPPISFSGRNILLSPVVVVSVVVGLALLIALLAVALRDDEGAM